MYVYIYIYIYMYIYIYLCVCVCVCVCMSVCIKHIYLKVKSTIVSQMFLTWDLSQEEFVQRN